MTAMQDQREHHPTGPKFHPDSAQMRSFQEVIARRVNLAEALLDPGLPSFVLTKDIENANEMHKDGQDLENAVKLSQKYLTARFLVLLKKGLPNAYNVNDQFLEEFVRQKVRTDWCATELANYEHTSDGEEAKRLYDVSPDKDAPSGKWQDVGPSGDKYFSTSEKYQRFEKLYTDLQTARTEFEGMREVLKKHVEKHSSSS